MLEQWSKWEPVRGLVALYYVDYVIDGYDGFKVQLFEADNEKNKVIITFDESVYAYRSTYEGFRQENLHFLEEQYGKKFYEEWAFFKVTNSSYLKWLSEQSHGITDTLPFMHFSFLGMDCFLDIIAGYEPKIEIIIGE